MPAPLDGAEGHHELGVVGELHLPGAPQAPHSCLEDHGGLPRWGPKGGTTQPPEKVRARGRRRGAGAPGARCWAWPLPGLQTRGLEGLRCLC